MNKENKDPAKFQRMDDLGYNRPEEKSQPAIDVQAVKRYREWKRAKENSSAVTTRQMTPEERKKYGLD